MNRSVFSYMEELLVAQVECAPLWSRLELNPVPFRLQFTTLPALYFACSNISF
jgi:hypothetical protein